LRIVGSQPEGELPEFVESFGFINKSSEAGTQKLIELFQVSDFFILPTIAEAAGIVFSEASSYGLPSLAYATGGVTDYVRNGVNGFCFEPGTQAGAFASEILRIMEDPVEYESLSVQAFAEYRDRLNWETSVRRLIDFCAECCEN
jgi:glycosyltransferase involved in cell wall biosynthesis